ncbi:MAG TPA: hypothetical protein VHX38_20530 [Pseudonocardiaceae bacterium]|nr:hypothetical protein [Pseudonocardiaceae bacterium]
MSTDYRVGARVRASPVVGVEADGSTAYCVAPDRTLSTVLSDLWQDRARMGELTGQLRADVELVDIER